MSIRQRLVTVLAMTLGLATVTALSASNASAAPRVQAVAAPTVRPAPLHGANQNGCTLSPDSGVVSGVYFNFHNSCDWHDQCYAYKWYGNSSSGRLACDQGFRTRMRGWCSSAYSAWYLAYHRSVCNGVAETYYQAVRTFGGAFF